MSTPLRLLIIEDSEDDALLIVRDIQRAGYEPMYERVDTEGGVRAALEGKSWDIVVSDFNMPHFTGTDALKLLRERDQDAVHFRLGNDRRRYRGGGDAGGRTGLRH